MVESNKRAKRYAQSKDRIARRESINQDDRLLCGLGGITLGAGVLIMAQVGYQMTQSADRLNIFELGLGGAFAYIGGRVLWEVRDMNQGNKSSDNVIQAEFGQPQMPPTKPQPPQAS